MKYCTTHGHALVSINTHVYFTHYVLYLSQVAPLYSPYESKSKRKNDFLLYRTFAPILKSHYENVLK